MVYRARLELACPLRAPGFGPGVSTIPPPVRIDYWRSEGDSNPHGHCCTTRLAGEPLNLFGHHSIWHRIKDSNLDLLSQSQMCYHYTNSVWRRMEVSIPTTFVAHGFQDRCQRRLTSSAIFLMAPGSGFEPLLSESPSVLSIRSFSINVPLAGHDDL